MTQVLERGVQSDMDRALALLRHKSELQPAFIVHEVQSESDVTKDSKLKRSEKPGSSTHRHHSKRHESGYHSGRAGGVSTLRLTVGSTCGRPPTFSSYLQTTSVEAVWVEVAHSEWWTVGNRPPAHSLRIFILPQVEKVYIRHSRAEIVDRTQSRPGRVRYLYIS